MRRGEKLSKALDRATQDDRAYLFDRQRDKLRMLVAQILARRD